MSKPLAITWIDHRTDLPNWIVTALGRIAVEYSDLEWQLEEMIRVLLDTSVKLARITTTSMSFRSRCQIADLLIQAHVWDETVSDTRLRQFRTINKNLIDCDQDRNTYIHGLWGYFNNSWGVLRVKGSQDGDAHPSLKEIKRAVVPKFHPVTADDLKKTLILIRDTRSETEKLRHRFESEFPASPHKSPRQHVQGDSLRRRSAKTQ